MFAYDKTFDPKVVLGQYDLISRFSDFYAPNFEENEGAYWFGSVRPVQCSPVQSVGDA